MDRAPERFSVWCVESWERTICARRNSLSSRSSFSSIGACGAQRDAFPGPSARTRLYLANCNMSVIQMDDTQRMSTRTARATNRERVRAERGRHGWRRRAWRKLGGHMFARCSGLPPTALQCSRGYIPPLKDRRPPFPAPTSSPRRQGRRVHEKRHRAAPARSLGASRRLQTPGAEPVPGAFGRRGVKTRGRLSAARRRRRHRECLHRRETPAALLRTHRGPKDRANSGLEGAGLPTKPPRMRKRISLERRFEPNRVQVAPRWRNRGAIPKSCRRLGVRA